MLGIRKISVPAILLAGLSLSAGKASALSFGVGPLGGLNLGDLSVDYPSDFGVKNESELKSGLALGARAEFGVTNPFSLLVEPMFLQRGTTEKITGQNPFSGEDTTVTLDERYNFLEIPVLAKAKFGSMKAHAYAFAGPSIGIFLNGEAESGGETEKADSISTISFSGDIGVGGGFQVAEYVYLNADVRYSLGFNNLNDAKDKVEAKSRDIMLMVGVLFHLTQ